MRVRGVPIFLSTLLLGGIAAERYRLSAPAGAAAYHDRVRQVAASAPEAFDGWRGTETEVPAAAVSLLKPNVIISRRFVNERDGRAATFLLVQCQDTRELVAHYPPVCYPGRGYKLQSANQRKTTIDGLEVSWTDYTFVRQSFQEFSSIVASHAIVMPNGMISADMDAMRTSAARVQDRFLGAAQIHVVTDASVGVDDRTEILKEMIRAHRGLIDAIRTGTAAQ